MAELPNRRQLARVMHEMQTSLTRQLQRQVPSFLMGADDWLRDLGPRIGYYHLDARVTERLLEALVSGDAL